MLETHSAAVPWQVQDVVRGTLLAFGLFLALMLSLVFLPENNRAIGPVLGLGELIFLLPLWWFTVRKYRVSWRVLGLGGFAVKELAIALALLVIGYSVNISYTLGLAAIGLETPDTLTPLLETGIWPGWVILGAAVSAPFIEELFFRGFVYAGLKTRFKWPAAALISAALFAVSHLDPLTLLPIFVLGLLLAYMYERSKSIWPAILMHTFINSCALVVTFLVYSGAIPAA